MSRIRRTTSEIMGDELFHSVEYDQGYAFISDAIDILPPREIYALAQKARRHHKKCVALLTDFIRKHEPKFGRVQRR